MKASRPDISAYNDFTADAAKAEQAGNYDYARKMWDEASIIAARRCWRAKLQWCEARMAFCEKQMRPQGKRK